MSPTSPWTLYLIHHSHTDLGYTEPQGRIERWHVEFIRQALAALRGTAGLEGEHFGGFKWQCETFWQVESFLAVAEPEERAAFLAAVRNGRMGVSGSYLNFNELLDESNLRAATGRAAEFGRVEGLPVTSAMTADINGYSWGFARILLERGIRNLFTCIHTHHGMYPLGRQQTGFRWETPDGEQVLVWSGEHYHFGNELGLVPGAGASYLTKDDCDAEAVFEKWWTLAERRIPRYLRRLADTGYRFRFVPVMASGLRTDNGPPSEAIAVAVERWNRKHGDLCRVEMATLDDFFGRLEPHARELPIHRGDWPDWWSDGPAGNPQGTRLFRQAQRDLDLYRSLLECSDAVAAADPTGDLEAAARQELILYAEHTFSHQDAMSRPGHLLVQAISGNKQARAARGLNRTTELLDRAGVTLGGGNLSARMPLCYRIINPWSRPLVSLVRLAVGHHEFYERRLNRGAVVRHSSGGAPLAWWLGSVPRGEDFCVEVELEPGQECVLEIVAGNEEPTWPPEPPRRSSRPQVEVASPQDPDSGTLQTDLVLLGWDRQQGIHTWQDQTSGRSLLRGDRRYEPFTLIHEITPVAAAEEMLAVRGAMGLNRKGDDVQRTVARITAARAMAANPHWHGVELTLAGAGIDHCRLELRAWRRRRRVDVCLRLHKTSCWEPENLYCALPFTAGDGEVLWLDKTAAAVRPWRDQIPGSLTDFSSVQGGAAWVGSAGGVGVATLDSNLLQLGPLEPGERLLMGDARLPDAPPEIQAWLMTNYWETNFAAELGGFHEFRFNVTWGRELAEPEVALAAVRDLSREPYCCRLAVGPDPSL